MLHCVIICFYRMMYGCGACSLSIHAESQLSRFLPRNRLAVFMDRQVTHTV